MLRELVSSQGCGAPGGGNPFALLARDGSDVKARNEVLQPFRRTGVSEFVTMMGEERGAMGYEMEHELRCEMDHAGMMPMHGDGMHHGGFHMPIAHHPAQDRFAGWAHDFEDETFQQSFQHRAPLLRQGNVDRATVHAGPQVTSSQAGSAWAAQMRVHPEAALGQPPASHAAELQHNAWHEATAPHVVAPPEQWLETFEGNPMLPMSAPRHHHGLQGRSLPTAAFHHPPLVLAGALRSKAGLPFPNMCAQSAIPHSKFERMEAAWRSDPIQSSIQSSTSGLATATVSKHGPDAGGGTGNDHSRANVRLREGAQRRIAALESILCTKLGGMTLDAQQQSSESSDDARVREGFRREDMDGVQCGRTGESEGPAVPQERTGPSSFECQDCGTTVQGASKDPNQCAYGLNRQGKRNIMCCVCALNHGWTKMYGLGCRQCKARAGFAVWCKFAAASEWSGEGPEDGLAMDEAYDTTFGMDE